VFEHVLVKISLAYPIGRCVVIFPPIIIVYYMWIDIINENDNNSEIA